MRSRAIIFAIAVVLGAMGGIAAAQNVKAYKGGGGATGFHSAAPHFQPTPGPTTY